MGRILALAGLLGLLDAASSFALTSGQGCLLGGPRYWPKSRGNVAARGGDYPDWGCGGWAGNRVRARRSHAISCSSSDGDTEDDAGNPNPGGKENNRPIMPFDKGASEFVPVVKIPSTLLSSTMAPMISHFCPPYFHTCSLPRVP